MGDQAAVERAGAGNGATRTSATWRTSSAREQAKGWVERASPHAGLAEGTLDEIAGNMEAGNASPPALGDHT